MTHLARRLLCRSSLALVATTSLLLAGGCGSSGPKEPVRPSVSVETIRPGSFRVAWNASLDTVKNGRVDGLYLRDDLLFAYTDDKVVQSFNSSSGRSRFIRQIVGPRDVLYPPVVLPSLGRVPGIDRLITFATASGFVVVNDDGLVVRETSLRRGLTTAPTGSAGIIYVGSADDNGGRLLKVDPLLPAGNILDRVLLDGPLNGRPAAFGAFVYAADLTGNVYGMTEGLAQAWPIREFETEPGRGVNADVVVDDFGVYVSGTDGTLHVLSRDRGRIVWRFFAGRPLYQRAVPTRDWVYQPMGDSGVAALPKFEGSTNSREPAWVAREARDFLSHDDANVYLLLASGRIGAFDKETGDKVFESRRSDFSRYARNVDGSRIYAATRAGEIVAIEPVLGSGEVGRTVMLDRKTPDAIAMLGQ
ncbi:MAG: PQQ-binding-like beta-propeller repeat protein [Planctomycetota bacterium]